MSATPDRLSAVLAAAERLLLVRQAGLHTVEEWANLARAVAACTGQRTSDLLTEQDLEEAAEAPPLPWDPSVDGPLAPPRGE